MALGTKKIYIDPVVFPTYKIPSGHGVSTSESALGTPALTEDFIFEIAAFDVVAATDIAGFDDLLNVELLADIDAYIAAATGLGIDVSTHGVDYNARVIDVQLGEGADIYLNTANINFKVRLQLRVYVSA